MRKKINHWRTHINKKASFPRTTMTLLYNYVHNIMSFIMNFYSLILWNGSKTQGLVYFS